MKKSIIVCLLLIAALTSSCGKEAKNKGALEPEVSRMKSICELATMDCYYHNVAKYKEDDADGILWWKKDKNFWIEYAGVVTIGIDASLVNIDVTGDQVTITMPPAKVLDCKVDEKTLSEDSFIIAKDSADVMAQDQTEAFKAAQSNMEKSASEDSTLLANAQQRAQKLLEDYVNNIGDTIGRQYKIKWVYVQDDVSIDENEESEENEEKEDDKTSHE